MNENQLVEKNEQNDFSNFFNRPKGQIPLWPEEQRAMPSELVRAAVFGVAKKGNRSKHDEWKELPAWGDTKISWYGELLDQNDHQVFSAVLHLLKGRNLKKDDTFVVSIRQIIKVAGRRQGGGSTKWVVECMNRLTDGRINIESSKFQFKGGLISSFYLDKETNRYSIKVDSTLSDMFIGHFTTTNHEITMQLSGALTRWIYGYVASHNAHPGEPHRIGLDKLKKIARVSPKKTPQKFAYEIREAMKQLERLNVVSSWKVYGSPYNLMFEKPYEIDKIN